MAAPLPEGDRVGDWIEERTPSTDFPLDPAQDNTRYFNVREEFWRETPPSEFGGTDWMERRNGDQIEFYNTRTKQVSQDPLCLIVPKPPKWVLQLEKQVANERRALRMRQNREQERANDGGADAPTEEQFPKAKVLKTYSISELRKSVAALRK